METHLIRVLVKFDHIDDINNRERPDVDTCFLPDFPARRLKNRLSQLLQPAGKAPLASSRRGRAPDEQRSSITDDDGADSDERMRGKFAWHCLDVTFVQYGGAAVRVLFSQRYNRTSGGKRLPGADWLKGCAMFEDFESQDVRTRETTIHVVSGGAGPPLLLLHGYPQTHVMWHKIAPELAKRFTVVATDLRGYGDSGKPASDASHLAYSKRKMAADQVEVMRSLGFDQFFVAGHDRGARVAHRMAIDHAERVEKLAVLDIVPTHHIFATVDKQMATAYYHWFFLIQGGDLPETLIGHDPAYYLRAKLRQWAGDASAFDPRALAEYGRCFDNPACIHATCEDYRAAASIDLDHDEADLHRKIERPLLVLWGDQGFIGRRYDPLACWRERACDVRGRAMSCGHFLAEERPQETLDELLAFFTER
jgi:haloacetate dehalogenase